ncbi:hypothetical protein MMC13_005277 [Lambiella insularis]|nr:hypothetical protein [Lambiella insularis]
MLGLSRVMCAEGTAREVTTDKWLKEEIEKAGVPKVIQSMYDVVEPSDFEYFRLPQAVRANALLIPVGGLTSMRVVFQWTRTSGQRAAISNSKTYNVPELRAHPQGTDIFHYRAMCISGATNGWFRLGLSNQHPDAFVRVFEAVMIAVFYTYTHGPYMATLKRYGIVQPDTSVTGLNRTGATSDCENQIMTEIQKAGVPAINAAVLEMMKPEVLELLYLPCEEWAAAAEDLLPRISHSIDIGKGVSINMMRLEIDSGFGSLTDIEMWSIWLLMAIP